MENVIRGLLTFLFLYQRLYLIQKGHENHET